MAVLIKQKTDPILRQIAAAVTEDLPNVKISRIIEVMQKALDEQVDGVALAAPQIGISKQIFVVSPRAFVRDEDGDKKNDGAETKMLVFINPRIVKKSRQQIELVEGCLSARGLYGRIKRHAKVSVEAFDEKGRRFTRHTSGLLAQIMQHEIDHLRGGLFIDRAYDFTEAK